MLRVFGYRRGRSWWHLECECTCLDLPLPVFAFLSLCMPRSSFFFASLFSCCFLWNKQGGGFLVYGGSISLVSCSISGNTAVSSSCLFRSLIWNSCAWYFRNVSDIMFTLPFFCALLVWFFGGGSCVSRAILAALRMWEHLFWSPSACLCLFLSLCLPRSFCFLCLIVFLSFFLK